MSVEAVGSIGEILGALAVLVSLIYLAKQIKHSTDVSKVTTYQRLPANIIFQFLNGRLQVTDDNFSQVPD